MFAVEGSLIYLDNAELRQDSVFDQVLTVTSDINKLNR
jgi:hypothetical protein